jgi:hypothetical protein
MVIRCSRSFQPPILGPVLGLPIVSHGLLESDKARLSCCCPYQSGASPLPGVHRVLGLSCLTGFDQLQYQSGRELSQILGSSDMEAAPLKTHSGIISLDRLAVSARQVANEAAVQANWNSSGREARIPSRAGEPFASERCAR